MALAFQSRPDVWTYLAAVAGDQRDAKQAGSPPARTVSAFQRLSARMADAIAAKNDELIREVPDFAFARIATLLHGERLKRIYDSKDKYGDPLHHNTVDAYAPRLESAYGLPRNSSRRARAFILLAAEYKLAPLIEGNLTALDAGPASTRVDLRGAFHLVSRWWWQNEPLLLPRLAVSALQMDGDGVEPLPFRPLTVLYEAVLSHHRPVDLRRQEAHRLSVATTRILYEAYIRRSLKREIMQQLFEEAERIPILDRRPIFDVDPVIRRRNELTRVALACELGSSIDPVSSDLIELLHEPVRA